MAATTALLTLPYPVRWPHRIVRSHPMTLRRESKRNIGIEPMTKGWKPLVLPLN
jgi:hypothetical protein